MNDLQWRRAFVSKKSTCHTGDRLWDSHSWSTWLNQSMELDEDLCLCFHVSKRKVVNFIRVEKPKRAGQLAECFGAGTGCGWCREYLRMLFDQANSTQSQSGPRGSELQSDHQTTPSSPSHPPQIESHLPSAQDYAAMRKEYIRQGKGKPPPGTLA